MSSQESYVAYKKRKYLSRIGAKRRIKPTYVSRARIPMYKSMRDRGVYEITKSCSIGMNSGTGGYTFNVGIVASEVFSIWFSNQDAWIWGSSTLYSTTPVPGYNEISALFDEVMIDRVEIVMITGTDPTTATNGSAQIVSATDYNDRNAPVQLSDVLQYADTKYWNCSNNFVNRRVVRPKFLTYTMDASLSPLATTPKRGYIASNTQIDHFGLKCAFLNKSPNNQNHMYHFKYFFKCKVTK